VRGFPRGKRKDPADSLAHILGARVVHATAATRIYFYLNFSSSFYLGPQETGRSVAHFVPLPASALCPLVSELIAVLVFFAMCRPQHPARVYACMHFVRVHARTKARTDVTRVKNARRFLTRRSETAVLYRSRFLDRVRERARHGPYSRRMMHRKNIRFLRTADIKSQRKISGI